MPHDPRRFTGEPLHVILAHLRDALSRADEVTIDVPDPDLGHGLYPGETTAAGRHRPLRVWVDVADRLECDLRTPVRQDDRVRLTFRALPAHGRFRARDPERYGAHSDFQRVDKLEDPYFLEDMLEALGRAAPPRDGRVLSVGVNSGNELRLLDLAFPGHTLDVVGVDISDSALDLARTRFTNATFHRFDVNDLPAPQLGRFDVILAIGTLQSQGIDQDRVFRTLLREHLTPGGSIILGLPNCRYEGGRVSWGARLLNFRKPELSLLMKDAALYRRHLQKHGYRVYVTGKYDVLVTGVPVERS